MAKSIRHLVKSFHVYFGIYAQTNWLSCKVQVVANEKFKRETCLKTTKK